jgi:hypothetical protein
MPDVLDPVAPPAAVPIAPAPAMPVNAAAIVASQKTPADTYNDAIENGDTNTIKALVKSPDPDVATAAKNSVAVIAKNEPLANHLSQIDPTKPEGRLELAKTFQTLNKRDEAKAKGWTTIQDSPQIGTALLRYALGDKQGAMRQITGGDVKSSTEYDDNGNMLVVNRNELGQIDSVFDKNGNMISREDYANRGGSRALDDTLYRIKQKQEQESNIKSYLKDTEGQNKSAGALGAAAGYSKDMADLTAGLKDISPENQELLAGFNTSTLNYQSNINKTVGTLNSLATSKGKDLSADQAKSIEAATGSALGAVVKYIGKDQFTINGKETVSASDLAQRTSSSSASTNIDRSVQQARDNVAKQIRIAQQEGAPAEKIQQLSKLDRYFELAGMREKIYAENKDKMPSFVQLPTQLPNIADTTSRLKLNALQGEYAAAQMDAFLKWKDSQLRQERAVNPNFVPEPGRYEAQWPKQKEFVDLENSFRNKAKDVLNETPAVGKTINPAALSVGPINPAQANVNEPAVPPKATTNRADQFKVLPNSPAANNEGFKVRRPKQ